MRWPRAIHDRAPVGGVADQNRPLPVRTTSSLDTKHRRRSAANAWLADVLLVELELRRVPRPSAAGGRRDVAWRACGCFRSCVDSLVRSLEILSGETSWRWACSPSLAGVPVGTAPRFALDGSRPASHEGRHGFLRVTWVHCVLAGPLPPMQRTMQVFVIPKGSGPGGGPPLPARKLTVEAQSLDGLRDAGHAALTADGYRIRSLSFGPGGLVAYVEQCG